MRRKRITLKKIITRNLSQNGFRTGAMLLLVFLLSATLYGTTFVAESLKSGLQSTIKQVNADILIVPGNYIGGIKSALFQGEPVTITFSEDITKEVSQIRGVGSVSTQFFLTTLNAGCCDGGSAQLIAYDTKEDIVEPWIDDSISPYIGLYNVVVGSDMEFEVGGKATFFGEEFNVAGKLNKTGMGYDKSAFITKETARALSQNSIARSYFSFDGDNCAVSTLQIKVEKPWSADDTAREIRKELQGKSVIVYTTEEFVQETEDSIKMFEMASNILLFLLFLVAIFSFILVFGITINERQKEFGILASIGGTKLQATGIILGEALCIVLLGSLLGIIFGESLVYAGRQWLKNTCGLPVLYPGFSQQGFLAARTMIIAGGSGVIAAMLSAVRMNITQPYLLIKENE